MPLQSSTPTNGASETIRSRYSAMKWWREIPLRRTRRSPPERHDAKPHRRSPQNQLRRLLKNGSLEKETTQGAAMMPRALTERKPRSHRQTSAFPQTRILLGSDFLKVNFILFSLNRRLLYNGFHLQVCSLGFGHWHSRVATGTAFPTQPKPTNLDSEVHRQTKRSYRCKR